MDGINGNKMTLTTKVQRRQDSNKTLEKLYSKFVFASSKLKPTHYTSQKTCSISDHHSSVTMNTGLVAVGLNTKQNHIINIKATKTPAFTTTCS